MHELLCINREIRERYTVAWARAMAKSRSDIPQDPRNVYRCLRYWSVEYTRAARACLRLIRIHGERGTLTSNEVYCELDSFRYFRQMAHAYLAASNEVYQETCAQAEKMQAFVKSGCKSTLCDYCGELEYQGDRHHHDYSYVCYDGGSAHHEREDFHADG